MKAVTAEQMRAIEQASVVTGVSLDALMEKAGLAVAKTVEAELGGAYGNRIAVLVGPGNNGGDGLVAARHLAMWGARVRAFMCAKRPENDPKLELAVAAGVQVLDAQDAAGIERLADMMPSTEIVIDAVLGTGRARQITPPLSDALFAVLQSARPVVAIDLPTGLNSDTGRFDPHGLPADITLMLGYPKLGAVAEAGEGVCGEIRVLDIGIPPGLDSHIKAEWIDEDLARSLLPDRPGDSHKGTFGRTLIIGGSPNYLGAALLSTSSALRSGAGLVFLAAREPVYRLVAGRIEGAIYYSLPARPDGEFAVREACITALDASKEVTSVLVGPGLGQSAQTVQFLEQLVRSLPENAPVVLDADALNILSRMPKWWEQVAGRKVLTPHPGEMSRLMGSSTQDVQKDRIATAQAAAERFNATVVFKGAATVIAEPGGRLRISPWVNSGLAKGGTGDVLAGLLAGLLAQSPDQPFDMASAAVYVHGLAGELARRELGEVGMTAGDVAAKLPAAFKQLMA